MDNRGNIGRASARLDQIYISTWRDDYQWNACLGEYDEGALHRSGVTQRDAINELLDALEQDNGELHR